MCVDINVAANICKYVCTCILCATAFNYVCLDVCGYIDFITYLC